MGAAIHNQRMRNKKPGLKTSFETDRELKSARAERLGRDTNIRSLSSLWLPYCITRGFCERRTIRRRFFVTL